MSASQDARQYLNTLPLARPRSRAAQIIIALLDENQLQRELLALLLSDSPPTATQQRKWDAEERVNMGAKP